MESTADYRMQNGPVIWDRVVENNHAEQQKEKRIKRKEDRLRDIYNNFKHNTIHIIGIPEGKEK